MFPDMKFFLANYFQTIYGEKCRHIRINELFFVALSFRIFTWLMDQSIIGNNFADVASQGAKFFDFTSLLATNCPFDVTNQLWCVQGSFKCQVRSYRFQFFTSIVTVFFLAIVGVDGYIFTSFSHQLNNNNEFI